MTPSSPNDQTMEQIARAVRSIRFGTVQVVVQNGKVVQIEKTEKIRLDKADQSPGGISSVSHS